MSRCPECNCKHNCADWCGKTSEELYDEIVELREQNDLLREGLSYYAKGENLPDCQIQLASGKRAKEILTQVGESTK